MSIHPHSLQQMISTTDVDTFYPVNLDTRLKKPIPNKTCWIHRNKLAIYSSLNRAKTDGTYPVWSSFASRNISKCKTCVAVSCMLETIRDKTTSCSNRRQHFLTMHVNLAISLFLMFLMSDKRHGIGWHVLASYD